MNAIANNGLPMTLPDLLNDQATQFPEQAALSAPRKTGLSYSALMSQVDRVQAALSEFGLGRSDRVALVLPNGPGMAAAFLGVASGAVCAPLNPGYTADGFDFFLSDLNVKALIVEAGSDSAAVGVARRRRIEVLELAQESSAPAGIFSLHGRARGAVSATPTRPDDVALLLHTSGTTSRPKLVPLTHRNLYASAFNVARTLGLSPTDCCLNVMPLFHIHGLVAGLLSTLASGGSVVCPPDFSAPDFFEWMAEFHPTWYTAVPTMHQAALAHARDHADVVAAHRLRFIRSSSAALPASVMVELEALFKVPVIEAYGATEAAHQMASNPLPPRARKPRSVGVAAGPEVAIMDFTGSQLPQGEPGEVVIRGANVMPGYENDAAANLASFADGWFRTGDQGYLDADGYLFLTGRLKEVINRGGEKISPREVDDALLEHPAIAQVVAFALPHPTLGEDLAAAVVLKEGHSASAQAIRDFLFERLPGFKIPSLVVVVPALPKGPTGKVQRIGLAAELAEHMKSSVGAPRNDFERIVVETFAEVLKIADFGIDDNFFALGGDSLHATQIANRLASIFDIELPNVVLFRKPTASELAAEIATLLTAVDPDHAEVFAGLHPVEELDKLLADLRNE